MKSFKKSLFTALACLTLAVSCGGDKSSSSRSTTPAPGNPDDVQEEVEAPEPEFTGQYLAEFTTINGHVVGTIPGSATIHMKESKLYTYLRLFGGSPKAWHQQSIHLGNRCPTLKDDTNGDGYIDINESNAAVGNVIVPLDSDISTQNSGRNFYPLGDLSGNYHYERITSYERFLSDLRDADKNPADNVVKLTPDEPFTFENKVIIIQGTAETVIYPPTVGTTGRFKPFQTLPIVCGVFKRVTTTPGVPDTGIIPGPVAEVEEGQDRPSEDPLPDTTTPGETDTTTNDSDRGEDETSDDEGNRNDPNHTEEEERTSTTTNSSSRTSSTNSGTNSTPEPEVHP